MKETFRCRRSFVRKCWIAIVVFACFSLLFGILAAISRDDRAAPMFICALFLVSVVCMILLMIKRQSFQLSIDERGLGVSKVPNVPWENVVDLEEQTIDRGRSTENRLRISYLDGSHDIFKDFFVWHWVDGYEDIKQVVSQNLEKKHADLAKQVDTLRERGCESEECIKELVNSGLPKKVAELYVESRADYERVRTAFEHESRKKEFISEVLVLKQEGKTEEDCIRLLKDMDLTDKEVDSILAEVKQIESEV